MFRWHLTRHFLGRIFILAQICGAHYYSYNIDLGFNPSFLYSSLLHSFLFLIQPSVQPPFTTHAHHYSSCNDFILTQFSSSSSTIDIKRIEFFLFKKLYSSKLDKESTSSSASSSGSWSSYHPRHHHNQQQQLWPLLWKRAEREGERERGKSISLSS